MEGNFMIGAVRIGAAAFIAAFALTQARAAELTPVAPQPLPPAPPIFYLHVGALGAFFEPDASSTGGGFFNSVAPGGVQIATIGNVAIRPNYTLGLELGYYVTPNLALVLSAGVPPIAHIKVSGFSAAGPIGSNLLGSIRWGPAIVLLRYQFNQFGALQPYVGVGAAYLLNLGNINDGILTNFAVDQNWGFAVQAGAEYMLTPNWGVFVDGKKLFLSTDASGFLLNTTIPIRTHVDLDPWVGSAGITFKY
jgi:outer membrane protein